MIRIVVDGAPVAKGRGRVGVNKATGRALVFTPAATRSYENTLRLAASQAMQGRAPLDQPLAVTVTAYLPIPSSWSQKKQGKAALGLEQPTKRPDGDNFLKAALDGCNSIVWRDDALIVDMRVVKKYDPKPRLEIEVAPVVVGIPQLNEAA